MTNQEQYQRAKAMRRRRLLQRQTLIYGTLILVLLVVLIVNVLIWNGSIGSPFSREFTTKDAPHLPTTVGCPAEDGLIQPIESLSVAVLNGTSRPGLARSTADILEASGITITDVGDWKLTAVPGIGVIKTGSAGMETAYTLQLVFPGMPVVSDGSESDAVTVILGDQFDQVGDPNVISPGSPIEVPGECAADAAASDWTGRD